MKQKKLKKIGVVDCSTNLNPIRTCNVVFGLYKGLKIRYFSL
jgi:hypothetical protein